MKLCTFPKFPSLTSLGNFPAPQHQQKSRTEQWKSAPEDPLKSSGPKVTYHLEAEMKQ